MEHGSAQGTRKRSTADNDLPEMPRAELSVVEASPVDKVRQVLAEADEAGKKRPGRPTLIKRTGLTSHQVLKALAEIDAEDDQQQPATDQQESTAVDSGRFRSIRHIWPLIVICLPAGVSVWSGWVGLGQLTGFGVIQLLPGIADDVRVNTSIVLPISVEAYGAFALGCWLTAGVYSARTVRFAKWSAVVSLLVGFIAQAAYHLMAASGMTRAPSLIIVLVAGVPVIVLGLASALAKMVVSDRHAADAVDEAGDR